MRVPIYIASIVKAWVFLQEHLSLYSCQSQENNLKSFIQGLCGPDMMVLSLRGQKITVLVILSILLFGVFAPIRHPVV